MKRAISIVTIVCVSVFALLTLWEVTVHGLLESPNLNADHFVAGAGNPILVVRFWLCLATIVLFLAWLPFHRSLKSILSKLGIAILVVGLFVWSALGLERFSPDYAEEAFQRLGDRFSSGESVSGQQVQDMLGDPLLSGRQDILIEARPHTRAWLYSYMPSCGFGWQKRVVYLDSAGQMVDYTAMDEP